MQSAGPAADRMFPRSALKPLSSSGVGGTGLSGSGPELAVAAASHCGEPVHLHFVRWVLDLAGLSDRDLQCPPALPSYRSALVAHVVAGGLSSRLMQCAPGSTHRCWRPRPVKDRT